MKNNLSACVRATDKNSGFGLHLCSELKYKHVRKDVWKGLQAIPPGSFIETVVADFNTETSIALQLPVMMSFVYLSSYLCQRQVKVDFGGVEQWPTLWVSLLAESGAAKTYTLKFLREMFGDVNCFTSFSTSKEFIEILSNKPNTLWIQDEFGPFFKNMKDQTYLAETNKYLLDAYGHETITRNTGGVFREIDEPVLNILGTSATASFFEDFDPKHFLTGLAQRFLWIVVEKPNKQKALWNVRKDKYTVEIKQRWDAVVSKIRSGTIYRYLPEDEAEKAFETAYESMCNTTLGDDFYRRIMFAAAKSYSVVYHILLGKAEKIEIDAEDLAWATRLAFLHVQDTEKIIELAGGGRLAKLIDKAEALAERIRQKEGRELTARDIARNMNAVKSTAEAKQILEMINK